MTENEFDRIRQNDPDPMNEIITIFLIVIGAFLFFSYFFN
jgi:hypothetical protein